MIRRMSAERARSVRLLVVIVLWALVVSSLHARVVAGEPKADAPQIAWPKVNQTQNVAPAAEAKRIEQAKDGTIARRPAMPSSTARRSATSRTRTRSAIGSAKIGRAGNCMCRCGTSFSNCFKAAARIAPAAITRSRSPIKSFRTRCKTPAAFATSAFAKSAK